MKNALAMLALALALVFGALTPTAAKAQSLIDGTVTKVDAGASKITIRHGPIKKLGMDEGMTMVFTAKDPALVGKVKAGDKVKFDADNVNGQFIVTAIEKAK
ncbi:RND transporter [Pseudolabrys taiwanensis]|uniref:RND transporter n=1 Tax=Pseudolabrys taiwanensis TaxID=331696 RepID=A0A345ZZ68_9HYPH|nr:copper-binding protein [Pseudolabrys taiwanensis]AXK82215.1 RND transporter [Pseudolabrys taiwanensis]